MRTQKVRYYVVLPGRGRQLGIYDEYEDALRQTNGVSHAPKRFDSLDAAKHYWEEMVPEREAPLHLRWTDAQPNQRRSQHYRATIDGPNGRIEAELTDRQLRSLGLLR